MSSRATSFFIGCLSLVLCLVLTDESHAQLKDPKFAYDKANVSSLCKATWEKRGKLNRRMFRYCKKSQRKGYKNLKYLLKKNAKMTWLPQLLPRVWQKWTKRGVTNYSMTHFGLKRELEGFLDYSYEKKQGSYNASKMNRCLSKWLSKDSPWSMTMFCYKRG